MGLISRVSSRTYSTKNLCKMADPRTKQLRIQGGVVKRTAKELKFYREEAKTLLKDIDSMTEKNEDEYYIGKKRELVQENNATSDDSKRRLEGAVEKLEGLVSDSKDELSEAKEYQEAVEHLELAKS